MLAPPRFAEPLVRFNDQSRLVFNSADQLLSQNPRYDSDCRASLPFLHYRLLLRPGLHLPRIARMVDFGNSIASAL
jgi:hypothetical protein